MSYQIKKELLVYVEEIVNLSAVSLFVFYSYFCTFGIEIFAVVGMVNLLLA